MPVLRCNWLRDRRSASRIMRWLFTITTAAYVAMLLWTTHAPRVPQPRIAIGAIPSDKVLHFFAYATLGILSAITVHAWCQRQLRMLVPLCAGLVVFALLDEVTQPIFGRATEVFDWVADASGVLVALCGWAACYQVGIWWSKKTR